MNKPDGIVAKFRIPLDEKCARRIASVVEEYPDHSISVEPPFLVIHEGGSA